MDGEVCTWCRQEMTIPLAEPVRLRGEREMPAEILAALSKAIC